MFVKILNKILYIFFSLLIFFILPKNLSSEEIHLHFPEELLMVEFDKHILPRFKFKTQIKINAVNSFENSDASIGVKTSGTSIFSDFNDIIYKVKLITSEEAKLKKIDKFIYWLNSYSR